MAVKIEVMQIEERALIGPSKYDLYLNPWAGIGKYEPR